MMVNDPNVSAVIEPDIKEKAEEILSGLGFSVSAGIDMFYRQIILWNGLPFRSSQMTDALRSLEEMSEEEFDRKMKLGLSQAKAGEGIEADDFFEEMGEKISGYYG